MRIRAHLIASAIVAAAALPAHAGIVTLGSTVTKSGTGFGNSNGWAGSLLADPSSITDGIFLPTSQQWNVNTVFWSGGSPDFDNVILVTLAQAASITSLRLQGDVNDLYRVDFEDLSGNWRSLATIAPNTNTTWGMGMGYASFSAVSAQALRITAVGGDRSYAVSELQAMGTLLQVPEPSTLLLVLAGLGAAITPLLRRK